MRVLEFCSVEAFDYGQSHQNIYTRQSSDGRWMVVQQPQRSMRPAEQQQQQEKSFRGWWPVPPWHSSSRTQE
jgi:hypothetical protein